MLLHDELRVGDRLTVATIGHASDDRPACLRMKRRRQHPRRRWRRAHMRASEVSGSWNSLRDEATSCCALRKAQPFAIDRDSRRRASPNPRLIRRTTSRRVSSSRSVANDITGASTPAGVSVLTAAVWGYDNDVRRRASPTRADLGAVRCCRETRTQIAAYAEPRSQTAAEPV